MQSGGWHALASRRRWNYKGEDGKFILTSSLSVDSTSYQLACTWGELSLKLGLLCSSALFSVIVLLNIVCEQAEPVTCSVQTFFILSNSNSVFPLIFPIANCCIIAGYSPVFPSHYHSQMTSIRNSPRPTVYEACNGAYLFCVHSHTSDVESINLLSYSKYKMSVSLFFYKCFLIR